MKFMKSKITKDMIMAEIITNWPQAAQVLIETYSLYCVGCSMAAYETLEQGLKGHGYDDEQIKKIVDKLNKTIS